jgi:hypothetical protein
VGGSAHVDWKVAHVEALHTDCVVTHENMCNYFRATCCFRDVPAVRKKSRSLVRAAAAVTAITAQSQLLE